MWTSLTRDDFSQAREQVGRLRIEMEARQAEERKALDDRHSEEHNELNAKEARLDIIERTIDAFVSEYLQNTSASEQVERTETKDETNKAETDDHPTPPPLELTVVATNWGNADFTPASDSVADNKSRRDWGG
jgi:hypothetical protein